jgi:hypothetical protein
MALPTCGCSGLLHRCHLPGFTVRGLFSDDSISPPSPRLNRRPYQQLPWPMALSCQFRVLLPSHHCSSHLIVVHSCSNSLSRSSAFTLHCRPLACSRAPHTSNSTTAETRSYGQSPSSKRLPSVMSLLLSRQTMTGLGSSCFAS